MRYAVVSFIVSTKREYEQAGEVRVKMWGARDIYTGDMIALGEDLETFFNLARSESYTFYVHELEYYGAFLLDYLLRDGYRVVDKIEKDKDIKAILGGRAKWYMLKVAFKKYKKTMKAATFYDSRNKIPYSLSRTATLFGLPYAPDQTAVHNIERDTQLLAAVLRVRSHRGAKKKITLSSEAADIFKRTMPRGHYKHLFPRLTYAEYQFMAPAYRGGWVYGRAEYENKILTNVHAYDINSLYAYTALKGKIPYGAPHKYTGAPPENHPAFIHRFECRFELREGRLPNVQIRHNLDVETNVNLTSSGPECVTLTMTSVDYNDFIRRYDVTDIRHIGGYWFEYSTDLFRPFVDVFYTMKQQARNKGERGIAKAYLVDLIGRLGAKQVRTPEYIELVDGVLQLRHGTPVYKASGYVPAAAFVTAYARRIITEWAEKCGDDFVYSDTDSLKTLNPPEGLVVSEDIGAWKDEGTADYFIYYKPKTYAAITAGVGNSTITLPDGRRVFGTLKLTAAGLADDIRDKVVNLKHFEQSVRLLYSNKTVVYYVRGGAIKENLLKGLTSLLRV